MEDYKLPWIKGVKKIKVQLSKIERSYWLSSVIRELGSIPSSRKKHAQRAIQNERLSQAEGDGTREWLNKSGFLLVWFPSIKGGHMTRQFWTDSSNILCLGEVEAVIKLDIKSVQWHALNASDSIWGSVSLWTIFRFGSETRLNQEMWYTFQAACSCPSEVFAALQCDVHRPWCAMVTTNHDVLCGISVVFRGQGFWFTLVFFWLFSLFLFFFKKLFFLLAYSCFTMLCWFLLYNKMNQPYVYIYPLPFGLPPHSGHHRALSGVPCTIPYILISYLCYTW